MKIMVNNLKTFIWIVVLGIWMSGSVLAAGPKVVLDIEIQKNQQVQKGQIVIQCDADKAPVSTQNFLSYVNSGYFKGTIFHRVINGFMIQGGGLDESLTPKKTGAPIKNEATNRLPNKIGSVAMARTAVIDSATSQFFINVANNDFLNHRDSSASGYGYAVFGQVVEGMELVNTIKNLATQNKNGYRDVPIYIVKIVDARIVPQP